MVGPRLEAQRGACYLIVETGYNETERGRREKKGFTAIVEICRDFLSFVRGPWNLNS